MSTLPQTEHFDFSDGELTALHNAYVASVNSAVAANDLVLADELARSYDDDLRDLNAQRAA